MASELQKQVSALQKHRNNPDSLISGKASLFLSKKEAGNIEINAVLEAAIGGLKALAQYDDRFSWCFNSILHQSSLDFQRELKTKEVIYFVFFSFAQGSYFNLILFRKIKHSMLKLINF
jgi:hypothetical protein